MDYYVERCLESLLERRIYRADLSLVRNDSKAAKLVVEFVAEVSKNVLEAEENDKLDFDAALRSWNSVEPLSGLKEATIRKYIAELWQGTYNMADRLKLQESDTPKFDISEYW